MFCKYVFVAFVSLLSVSYAHSRDVGDTIAAVTSVNGNGALGINAEKGVTNIDSRSTGSGSTSIATLATVVDSSTGAGRNVNIAVGYNSGTANIKATAAQGGTAIGALAAVVRRN